jgi:class 3 adenylate cyclase
VDAVALQTHAAAERLEEALALVDGELLPGLFQEWVYDARDAHRERVEYVLSQLGETAESAGDLTRAIELSRRRSALDPLSEAAARDLMRRLAAAGDRSRALAEYRRLSDRLRGELGIAPAPPTRQLADQLRSDDSPEAVPAGSSGTVPRAPGGALATVLFTDLVESTEAAQRIGDDAWERLLREHFALLRSALDSVGGRQVKHVGDGLMAAFDSPAAAVSCAVEMQRSVERHNRREGRGLLQMRVGIQVGEVSSDGSDYWGTPVVVAKRLCDVAQGGQILVSVLLRSLVGSRGGHRFDDAHSLELKGIAEPVEACTVAWEPETADRPPLPPGIAAESGRAFVGREDALEALRGRLDAARGGSAQIVVVTGEPGIGKTRLMHEFARASHGDGATVLAGRCYEEGLAPYQPFLEALTQYLATATDDELQRGLGPRAGELIRLMPELGDRLPGLAPVAGDPEGERYRLFDAVATVLAAAAADAPVLLLLDDLHWADTPTLLLLRHIVRVAGTEQILVVGSHREGAPDLKPDLQEALGDLARETEVVTLKLAGLEQGSATRLIDSWAGESVPTGFARAVRAETDGNPFFIGEVLRHIEESGVLTGGGDERNWDVSVEDLGIPEGVRQVIEGRLARLSEATNQLLRLAAVIGRDFELDLLQSVAGLSVDELLSALDEASGARILVEDDSGGDRWSFSHALVRDTLYESLSKARRVRLHRAIGEALEALHGTGTGAPLAELSHHFFRAAHAGDLGRAIRYAVGAAEQATALLAHEEAANLYERAVQALESKRPSDDERVCDLLTEAGHAHVRAGQEGRAREAFKRAAALARRRGDGERLGRAAIGFGGGIGGFGLRATVDDELISLLEEALGMLEPSDSYLRVGLLSRLAVALYYSLEHRRRRKLGREALEIATRLEDPAARRIALYSLNWSMLGPDDWEQREDAAAQVLALASGANDLEMVFRARVFKALLLLESGEMSAADEQLEFAAGLAETLRQPRYRWEVRLFDAMRALFEGRIGAGEELAAEAFQLGQQAGQAETAASQFGAQLFYVRWAQGRLEELESAARDFAERYPIPIWRVSLAFLMAELGSVKEASQELDLVAANQLRDLYRDRNWIGGMMLVSVACAVTRDAERAALVYDLLRPYADRMALIGGGLVLMGSVHAGLGICAATKGSTETAIEHFEAARERNGRIGERQFNARMLREYAVLLIERDEPGDVDRARDLLREALAVSRQVGMTRLVEQLEEVRDRLRTGAPVGD